MSDISIDVVSDVVCPWCFIGKRHLDKALTEWRAAHPDSEVTVNWHPFFLNPDTPEGGEPYRPFLEKKFGGPQGLAEIWQRVREAGKPAGVDFAFEKIELRANTLLAHRLIHWAQRVMSPAEPGTVSSSDGAGSLCVPGNPLCGQVTAKLIEALFAAQFLDGRHVGDRAILAEIAGACGFDAAAGFGVEHGSGLPGKQFGAVAGEPLPGVVEQEFGLGQAFGDRRGGDGVAFIVVEVALFAQRNEHDHPVLGEAHGFRQGLQCRLVVPGLAGDGAVAVGPEADHRTLHDGLVGGVEAVVGAECRQAGIGQVAPGRGQQALHTDRRALMQILLNLTNNAVKFTPQGSVVVTFAQVRADSGTLVTRFEVADTGVGIAPKDHDKLFQSFAQFGERDTRRNEGAGLGLHLSQRLAGLIGGIGVEQRHGSPLRGGKQQRDCEKKC